MKTSIQLAQRPRITCFSADFTRRKLGGVSRLRIRLAELFRRFSADENSAANTANVAGLGSTLVVFVDFIARRIVQGSSLSTEICYACLVLDVFDVNIVY